LHPAIANRRNDKNIRVLNELENFMVFI